MKTNKEYLMGLIYEVSPIRGGAPHCRRQPDLLDERVEGMRAGCAEKAGGTE